MADPTTVSAVILCRNEARIIDCCLESLVAQDFPADRLELLVVDGMSTDGTRDVVAGYSARHPNVKLVDNPATFIPHACNAGVEHSTGDLVLIMTAHATYDPGYVRNVVEASEDYDADNVVGVWRILPREDTAVARVIVRVLAHPFGVGNARYRTGQATEPEWVDTGASCFRREVFDRVGRYNEALLRGEDMEFNLRLKRAGGRTLLIPTAVVYYYARSDLGSLWRHSFLNGEWVIRPMLHTDLLPVSPRHLVPLAFVGTLLASAALALAHPAFLVLGAVALAAYLLAAVYFSARLALSERDPVFLLLGPLSFACLHVPYGLGSAWALAGALFRPAFWRNVPGAVLDALRAGRNEPPAPPPSSAARPDRPVR